LRVKYQFLGGVRNKRLDALVQMLVGTADTYFNTVRALQESGRIVPSLHAYNTDRVEAAKRMVARGWATRVELNPHGDYLVPSEFTSGQVYVVNPGACHCTCYQGQRGILCKHVQLVLELHTQDAQKFPQLSIHLENYRLKLAGQQTKSDVLGEVSVYNPLQGEEVFASAVMGTCTCTANSYFNDCACLRMAKGMFPDSLPQEASSDQICSSSDDPAPVLEQRGEITRKDQLVQRLQAIQERLETSSSIPNGMEEGIAKLESILKINSFPRKTQTRDKTYKPLHPHRPQIKKKLKEKMKRAAMEQPDLHPYSKKRIQHKDTFKASGKFKKPASKRHNALQKQKIRNDQQASVVTFIGLTVTQAAKEFLENQKLTVKLPQNHNMRQNFLQDMLLRTKLNAGGQLRDVEDCAILSALEKYFSA